MSKCPFLANKHEIFAGSPHIMSLNLSYNYRENIESRTRHICRCRVKHMLVLQCGALPNGVQGAECIIYLELGGGQPGVVRCIIIGIS